MIPEPRKNLATPRFQKDFSGWTAPVDLTAQADMPQKSATKLFVTNISEGATAYASIDVLLEGSTAPSTITVPPLTTTPYPGKFVELTSRGDAGADGIRVVAQWAD